MFLIGFPLLLIPFVLYNIFAFIFGVTDWTQPITSVHMRSGGEWGVSPSDLQTLVMEVLKRRRSQHGPPLGEPVPD